MTVLEGNNVKVMKKAYHEGWKDMSVWSIASEIAETAVLGGKVHPGRVTNVKWILERVLKQRLC